MLLFSCTASASQLSVKKEVQNTDIKTGDSVSISLEFENPFNKTIPVTIQDNNVIGSNGLEIQCYEYSIPDKPLTSLGYDFSIQAFSPGEFTLDPATITYTNPETGKQESVRSEQLKISIKQGSSAGQQQGVTKIYNCGGVSMRSTSYSSSGSTSISISSGSQQAQQSQQNPDNVQQTAQDMQNLKDEMNRQQQDFQEMQNELKSRIENTTDFRKMKQELEKNGYSQTENNLKPESNDTGDFEYRFMKNNESADINGRMSVGKMESINESSTEDLKRIQEFIENNETFQKMQKTLSDKGFNLTDKKIDLGSNISRFEYTYGDTNSRNASISGNVTGTGEIKDILKKEPPVIFPYWISVLLLIPLIGFYLYKKYNYKAIIPPAAPQVTFDYKKEALLQLENAIGTFKNGKQREAYTGVSAALRLYFRGTIGITELTSEEFLRILKGSKDDACIENVKHCFLLCDLVKFAKYEPNKADFDEAVEDARKIII